MESLEVDSLLRGYSINLVYVWKKDNKKLCDRGQAENYYIAENIKGG